MRCLNCNKIWNKNSVMNFIVSRRFYVCPECKDRKPLHTKECGISWYSLFYYQGAARFCVIKSKVEKKCMFSKHIKNMKMWPDIKKRLWVIPPSSKSFNHLEKTMVSLGVEYQECFEKIIKIKQSRLNIEGRKKENLDLIEVPKMKDIVIFDDTSTTGFTIREMVEKIGPNYNVIVLTFCTNKYSQ